jgi:hypothetical protein
LSKYDLFHGQLFAGLVICLACIAIHSVFIAIVTWAAESTYRRAEALSERPRIVLVMAAAVTALLIAHCIEVGLWGTAYAVLDVATNNTDAFYFAFVNYTTLGYGDLLPTKHWRLLGPVAAMCGILMFGWSTAVIYDVLRNVAQRMDNVALAAAFARIRQHAAHGRHRHGSLDQRLHPEQPSEQRAGLDAAHHPALDPRVAAHDGQAPTLRRIEQEFGVPGATTIVLWGLETDFGTHTGKHDVLRATATLGFDCRRAEFFQNELFEALSLVQKGDLTPADLRGDWAGELGQARFLPSSYNKYAIDFDGNGAT